MLEPPHTSWYLFVVIWCLLYYSSYTTAGFADPPVLPVTAHLHIQQGNDHSRFISPVLGSSSSPFMDDSTSISELRRKERFLVEEKEGGVSSTNLNTVNKNQGSPEWTMDETTSTGGSTTTINTALPSAAPIQQPLTDTQNADGNIGDNVAGDSEAEGGDDDDNDKSPSVAPSVSPTVLPSAIPSSISTGEDSKSVSPSLEKHHKKTRTPTLSSSTAPSAAPTTAPSLSPTAVADPDPTAIPTHSPTATIKTKDIPPTPPPSRRGRRTVRPTADVGDNDGSSPSDTNVNSPYPTKTPTPIPTSIPTFQVTLEPSPSPTKIEQEKNTETKDFEEEESGLRTSSIFIVIMGILGMYAIYRFVYGPRSDPTSSATQPYSPVPVHDEDRGDIEMNQGKPATTNSNSAAPSDWEEWDLEEDDDLALTVTSKSSANSGIQQPLSSNSKKSTVFPQLGPINTSLTNSRGSSSNLREEKELKPSTPRSRLSVSTPKNQTAPITSNPRSNDGLASVPSSASVSSLLGDSIIEPASSPLSPVPTLPKPPSTVLTPPIEQPLIYFDTTTSGQSVVHTKTVPSVPAAIPKKSRNIQPKQDDDIFASIGLSATPKPKSSTQVPDLDTIFAQHSSTTSRKGLSTKTNGSTSNFKSSLATKLSSRTNFEEEETANVASNWDEDKELDALIDDD